ncbi:MAG: hypothetical protein CMN30_07185 [Sandaracinus sp.]|nr:hypothetical protein [Sandaracinus sp.]
MAGTMTCFTKRLIAGLGTAWLALIILACTEDASETTVSGDFATGGGCPPGETCAAPSTGSRPVVFRASVVLDEPAPEGELPPVALGAVTRIVLSYRSESSGSGDPARWFGVPGHTIEAEGLEPVEGHPGWFRAVTTGTGTVWARDEDGALLERTRVRVERVGALRVAPRFVVGTLAATNVSGVDGWRIWPESEVVFTTEAPSPAGEPLVAIEDPEAGWPGDVYQGPEAGSLDLEARLGRFGTVSRYPVAEGIDGVRLVIPSHCGLLSLADDFVCVFGSEAGAPVLGAPLEVLDGNGDLLGYDPEFPCFRRGSETQRVTVSAAGSSFTLSLPAAAPEGEQVCR